MSDAGWTIVSGLAAGVDAAAHQGGLRGPGATVAVIGTGADIVYPARNRALAHVIAEGGCIVSEYPLGMPAIASNFPRRNRIISGLSRGVLVVEAAAQSGSLITARTALEQGREVFAIPGSIHSPLAKGCHQLIKQGAKLVESAQDIVEELQGAMPFHRAVSWQDSRQDFRQDSQQRSSEPAGHAAIAEHGNGGLLDALGYEAVHIDVLAARTGADVAALQADLLSLELDGAVEQLPGAQYRRLI
jgi:DNA processing protein